MYKLLKNMLIGGIALVTINACSPPLKTIEQKVEYLYTFAKNQEYNSGEKSPKLMVVLEDNDLKEMKNHHKKISGKYFEKLSKAKTKEEREKILKDSELELRNSVSDGFLEEASIYFKFTPTMKPIIELSYKPSQNTNFTIIDKYPFGFDYNDGDGYLCEKDNKIISTLDNSQINNLYNKALDHTIQILKNRHKDKYNQ